MTDPGTSTTEKTEFGSASCSGVKRKNEEIATDSDCEDQQPEPKCSKIHPDTSTREKCYLALVDAYTKLIKVIFPEEVKLENTIIWKHITISNTINSILDVCHNICKIEINIYICRADLDRLTKEKDQVYKIDFKGNQCVIKIKEAIKIWTETLEEYELVYKERAKSTKWIDLMTKLLNYSTGHFLRINEMQSEFVNITIEKTEDLKLAGLNRRHHVLLEGITYPPAKMRSMIPTIGPMTCFLYMLQADRTNRQIWEDAVKNKLGTIPVIEQVIRATRDKNIRDCALITSLVADIALLTTMQKEFLFFPLCMLNYVFKKVPDTSAFIDQFKEEYHGCFMTYNMCSNVEWYWNTSIESEKASQLIFHAIMGTFKVDLGILKSISNVSQWYTREEVLKDLRDGKELVKNVKIILPTLSHYSVTQPDTTCLKRLMDRPFPYYNFHFVFQGFRRTSFSISFIDRWNNIRHSGSLDRLIVNLQQFLNELTLKEEVDSNWGEIIWYEMKSVETNNSIYNPESAPPNLISANNVFI